MHAVVPEAEVPRWNVQNEKMKKYSVMHFHIGAISIFIILSLRDHSTNISLLLQNKRLICAVLSSKCATAYFFVINSRLAQIED